MASKIVCVLVVICLYINVCNSESFTLLKKQSTALNFPPSIPNAIIFPKDTTDEDDDNDYLGNNDDKSMYTTSYIPRRFRRQQQQQHQQQQQQQPQEQPVEETAQEGDMEDKNMIIIPGIAQLIPKFDELSSNQTALLAKGQDEFTKSMNNTMNLILVNFKTMQLNVEEMLKYDQDSLNNLTFVMNNMMDNFVNDINNSLAKVATDILHNSTVDLKEALNDSTTNTIDTLRRFVRDKNFEMTTILEQSLRSSQKEIEGKFSHYSQLQDTLVTAERRHYDYQRNENTEILQVFQQNTNNKLLTIEIQLNDLNKLMKLITLQQQQQQQFINVILEGAYSLQSPPIPYFPYIGSYYNPFQQSPVYPLMPNNTNVNDGSGSIMFSSTSPSDNAN